MCRYSSHRIQKLCILRRRQRENCNQPSLCIVADNPGTHRIQSRSRRSPTWHSLLRGTVHTLSLSMRCDRRNYTLNSSFRRRLLRDRCNQLHSCTGRCRVDMFRQIRRHTRCSLLHRIARGNGYSRCRTIGCDIRTCIRLCRCQKCLLHCWSSLAGSCIDEYTAGIRCNLECRSRNCRSGSSHKGRHYMMHPSTHCCSCSCNRMRMCH